jgi:hypothetical protein
MLSRIGLIAALIYTQTLLAAECGPTISAAPISEIKESLDPIQTALHQHLKSLTAALSAAEEREYFWVRLALDQSSELNHAVVHLLTLVQIRDAMVDKRDRYVLQRYASAQIVHLANLSRLTTESVALVLTKVRQPGIAIDVARLRDYPWTSTSPMHHAMCLNSINPSEPRL